jgi:hypothetical protein
MKTSPILQNFFKELQETSRNAPRIQGGRILIIKNKNVDIGLEIFSLSDNLDMPEDMSVPLDDCVLIHLPHFTH